MADGTEAPWFAGYDEETRGYLISRGLDKKTPTEAVAETIKAHRNAEAKLGIPSDRVLKLPEESDAEGWKQVWNKMGVPANPAEYDFTPVKNADGSALDAEFVKTLQTTAEAAKLTKTAAQVVAQAILKRDTDAKAAQDARDTIAKQMSMDKLRANWGANWDTFEFTAKRAGELLGLTADQMNTMANTVGYPEVMEGLRKVGVAMGEAKLFGIGGDTTGNRALSREEAKAELESLSKDDQFTARWGRGEKDALDRVEYLNKAIVGVPTKK